jgi:ABC-type sugar transport system substrate-binding protein
MALALISVSGSHAFAQGYDDGMMLQYYESAKGKRVAFVPLATTFDIAQHYIAGMQAQADALGYELIVRDPNWSVERAVEAINQLIDEHPDVIIVQPLDGVALTRLVQRANAEGIYWIWLNLKGPANGDAYVGYNPYDDQIRKIRLAANFCSTANSGKIAFITSPPTTHSAMAAMKATEDEMPLHPELELVATQSAEADASRAQAIASTILSQHPDLCAFIGMWDGADIGIPPAVAAANLTGTVGVFTSGGGAKEAGCDRVADGSYTGYIDYLTGQVTLLNSTITMLFQTKPVPGSQPFAAYPELRLVTRDNLDSATCWTLP